MLKRLIICVGMITYSVMFANPIKLLHLSFHKGCVLDIQEVADALNIELTNWYICDSGIPQVEFEGEHLGNGIHNINSERAKKLWHRHKDFFDTFDCIITSDTVPLSRIFLENNWQKPLIIWVCNRFDYVDPSPPSFGPAQPYYNLINAALLKPNVKIVPYTKYEHVYARVKGVNLGNNVIKPLGCGSTRLVKKMVDTGVTKSEQLFIYPRLFEKQQKHVESKCRELGINTYCGSYEGTKDLALFKAVLYFPYQYSNFALFENIQEGIVHFVPSEKFILNHSSEPIRKLTTTHFNLCEWYMPENRDLFIYFDSWDDLKNKFEMTDYLKKKSLILNKAAGHRERVLGQWKKVFSELFPDRF